MTPSTPASGSTGLIARNLLALGCLVAASLTGAAAWATPATYTLTHSKVSGTIGGTSFTDSVLEVQYTLSDTGLLTGSNGSFVRSPSFTGDQLAFTLTGGGLSSPVSGTFTSGNQFTVGASTAYSTGALFFMNPSFFPISRFRFQAWCSRRFPRSTGSRNR